MSAKQQEFERELAKLINRLSLEATFGNHADHELAAAVWHVLTTNGSIEPLTTAPNGKPWAYVHEAAISGTGQPAWGDHGEPIELWSAMCTCGWFGTRGVQKIEATREAWNHEVTALRAQPAGPTPPNEQTTTERARLKTVVLGFCENKMHRPWLRDLAKLFDP